MCSAVKVTEPGRCEGAGDVDPHQPPGEADGARAGRRHRRLPLPGDWVAGGYI